MDYHVTEQVIIMKTVEDDIKETKWYDVRTQSVDDSSSDIVTRDITIITILLM